MTDSDRPDADQNQPADADAADDDRGPAGLRVHGRFPRRGPDADAGTGETPIGEIEDDDAVPLLRDLEAPAPRGFVSDVNIDLGASGKPRQLSDLPDLPDLRSDDDDTPTSPARRQRPPVSDVNLDISPDVTAAAQQAMSEQHVSLPSDDTVVITPPTNPRTLMSLQDDTAWQRSERGDKTLMHLTPEATWQQPEGGDETLMEIRTGAILTPPRNHNTLLQAAGSHTGRVMGENVAHMDEVGGPAVDLPSLPLAHDLSDTVTSGSVAPPLGMRTILRDGMPEFDPPGAREIALLHQVEQMMPAARIAQRQWANVPLRRRLKIVNRIRGHLYRHRLKLVEAIDHSMTQTEIETVTVELLGSAEAVRDMVRAAPELIGSHQRWTCDPRLYAGRQIEVRRAPLGVIGLAGSTTWPLAELVRTLAGCMIAGNALIVAPGIDKQLADVLQEIFNPAELHVPDGLIQYLPAGLESRFALAGSPVDHLIITEADAAIRRHIGCRAHALASVTFRLPGAPAPMIITADADLDAAARAAITSSHRMSGRVPESIGRVYIEESVASEFLQLAARAALETRLGRMAGGFEVGPLESVEQLDRAEALINEAVDAGANIRSGGRRLADVKAPYLHATVLGNCNDSMRIVWEHFAPILPVIPLPDGSVGDDAFDDTVVASANRLPVQVASVFCGDAERAMRIAERLTAAMVSINDEPRPFLDARIPWPAGQGLGHGAVYGPEGLLELTRPVVITRDDGQLRFKPWWFPYSHAKVELARIMFRLRHAPGLFSRIAAWFRTLTSPTMRGVLQGGEIESLRQPRVDKRKKNPTAGTVLIRLDDGSLAVKRDPAPQPVADSSVDEPDATSASEVVEDSQPPAEPVVVQQETDAVGEIGEIDDVMDEVEDVADNGDDDGSDDSHPASGT